MNIDNSVDWYVGMIVDFKVVRVNNIRVNIDVATEGGSGNVKVF